jgi:predicted nucleic acid-binding protein
MRYCADTWFLLLLSEKDSTAVDVLHGVISGKDELVIPMVTVSETYRKLFERGASERVIETIFNELELIDKVQFVPLDKRIAIESGKVSFSYSVPLIDSIVAATGKLLKCHFILGKDEDLKKLQRKKYIKLKFW